MVHTSKTNNRPWSDSKPWTTLLMYTGLCFTIVVRLPMHVIKFTLKWQKNLCHLQHLKYWNTHSFHIYWNASIDVTPITNNKWPTDHVLFYLSFAINQSINQSIKQSKQIHIAPCVASESEARITADWIFHTFICSRISCRISCILRCYDVVG